MQWELADILQDKCSIEDAIIKVRDNLYIIPTFAIDGSLKNWSETVLFHKPYAFINFTDELEKLGFDIAFFDLGPGVSNLEKSVLSCMDEVIGVVAAEYFSFDGLETFYHVLNELKKDRRATYDVSKLVINRINKSYALHNAYTSKICKQEKLDIYQISQSTAISDCVPNHKSLFEYDSGNKNTSELQRLAYNIIGGN